MDHPSQSDYLEPPTRDNAAVLFIDFPALSLMRQGYHALIAVEASGAWIRQLEDAGLQRLVRAGAPPTSVE